MLKVTPRQDTPSTRSIIGSVWSRVDPDNYNYNAIVEACTLGVDLLIYATVPAAKRQKLEEVADVEAIQQVASVPAPPTGRLRCGGCRFYASTYGTIHTRNSVGLCRKPTPVGLFSGLSDTQSPRYVDPVVDYCADHRRKP